MLRAGVPVARAVRVAGESSSLREASEEIARGLEAGVPMDRLMARRLEWPGYVARMVAAGYAHGRLDAALLAAAEQMQWEQDMRRKVAGALVYPGFVLAALVGVALVVAYLTVPAFERLYGSVGAELPLLTRWVVASARWWPLVMVIGVIGAIISRRWLMLRLPLLGDILRGVREAQALRLIARLYEAGIVLTQCLEVAAGAARDGDMAARLRRAAGLVSSGIPVSVALETTRAFSRVSIAMVRAGEESGSLGSCMRDAADALGEEATHTARIALAMMEPMAAILVGGVALVCALALYVPIFDLPRLIVGGTR